MENMKRKNILMLGLVFVLALASTGCTAPQPSPTPTLAPSATPTSVPPTDTPEPTNTPEPAATSTATITATSTPKPAFSATLAASPTPPDVAALIEQAQAARKDLKTVSFSVKLSSLSAEADGPLLEASGYREYPDKAYMTASAAGQQQELLFLDKGTFYTKNQGTGEWKRKLSAQGDESLTIDELSRLDVTRLADEFTYQGVETIDGVPCYVLAFDANVKRLVKNNPALSVFLQVEGSSAAGLLWIGVEDAMIYRSQVELRTRLFGVTANLRIELNQTDFDKPVTFPEP